MQVRVTHFYSSARMPNGAGDGANTVRAGGV
jgi:hypothetical protein